MRPESESGALFCPSCDWPLTFLHVIVGVEATDRQDRYVCRGCGTEFTLKATG
jgi:transposase-like protein